MLPCLLSSVGGHLPINFPGLNEAVFEADLVPSLYSTVNDTGDQTGNLTHAHRG